MNHLRKTIGGGTTRNDLLTICKNLKLPFFKGIYSCDLIPNIEELGESFCIIVNTHPSTLSGEHWILLLYHQNELKISDSLNLPIKAYTQRLGEVVRSSPISRIRTNQVQHPFSWNCGFYVLHDMFLFHLKVCNKLTNRIKKIIWKYRPRACIINDKICICNISKMIPLIKRQ